MRWRIGSFMFLLLSSCTSANSAQSAGGPDGGAEKPLSCASVFDCAASCNDDPCAQVCLTKGSAEAREAAGALAKCFTDHACNDAACLQANCQGETDTCLTQGQPAGTPLGAGGAKPGNVPAELVGSWAHAAYGATERFKLNADGTGYYQTGLTSTNACAITQETIWNGTVVVDTTSITVYATSVTNTRFECGRKTETKDAPQTLHFLYTYEAGSDVLSTVDDACAAKYPDSPSSQSLYCKNAYARE